MPMTKGVSPLAMQAWTEGMSWWSPGPKRTDGRRAQVARDEELALRTNASAADFFSPHTAIFSVGRASQ